MHFYLPVAEMSANIFIFIAMGGAVGFLSGLFGVGGGFLMTPLLIFSGIPPAVAVGTEAAQIVASSVSGALAQWRRSNIDVAVGTRRSGQHNWIHGLPLKMRFQRSKLYISAIPPFLLGLFVGLLAAIMG